jgi:acetoin utilization protein AcuC
VSSLPHFYYTPKILDYTFGPSHPLKPERLRRTIELLGRYGVEWLDSGPGQIEDVLRVHDSSFIEVVQKLSHNPSWDDIDDDELLRVSEFGFGSGDNPPFSGMYEAALSYVGASAKAAEAVRDGAPLAFGIGGGLHHAQRALASGFCIFDDCAVACHILREKFDRVAYVDIDVHHGDGVQWIFYKDPTVLTCSIHEEGKSLYPGTGFADETGEAFSSLNVPMQAHTTGDVWLDAFERGILPGLEAFQPQAIVLQLGTDTHFSDPLAHIKSDVWHWLEAVKRIKALGIPLVALGGGGYNILNVPRMWTAACLTLGNIEFEDKVPEDLGEAWGMPRYFDDEQGQKGIGREYADGVIDWLERNHVLFNQK